MQHPTGYAIRRHGEMVLTSFWGLLLIRGSAGNTSNMAGSVVTAGVAMAAVARSIAHRQPPGDGRTFVRLGVIAASCTVSCSFPRRRAGRNIAWHQPVPWLHGRPLHHRKRQRRSPS